MKKVDSLFIIDDDNAFQFLTQEIISETELVKEIKTFSNGLEAIEYLKSVNSPEELPEIILLDLNMPVMDGWDFLEEYISVKPKLGKKITLYIVSSSINPSDTEKAKTISEVTDFIIKPVTKERFEAIVKDLCHRYS